MADISAIKIRKGIYKFESRKRYQYVQRYKVIEKQPVDKLKDSLKAFLSPKKPEGKKAAAAATAPPSGGFNFGVVAAAVIVALIILLAGFFWLASAAGAAQPVPFQKVEPGSLSNKVLYGEVLTAGSRGSPDHVAALFIDYQTTGLSNYSINLTTYQEALPTQVFILNSERIEASKYSDFLYYLRSDLGRKGVVLNEISLDQLETVPRGAEVIVPSGVIPRELLEGRSNLSSLTDRGVVVLYIGQSFKSMLNGTLVLTTPQQIQSSTGITFDEGTPQQCSGNFTLFQPLYSAASRGVYDVSSIYGCVPVLKKENGGTILLVPQTVDGGWGSDPVTAANDIARIVEENRWVAPDAGNASYFLQSSNDTPEISGREIFFTSPFQGAARTVKVSFTGYSKTGALFEDTRILRVNKTDLGELYVAQLAVTTTNVTGAKVRMNAQLNELVPASPLMSLVFTNNRGDESYRDHVGNINTQQEANLDVPIYVDEGEYRVTLEDDSSKVYAATYLSVESVSIKGPRSGATQAIYVFDVQTPITLKSLAVNVDSGKFTKTFSDVSGGPLSLDVTPYTGGDALAYGSHNFTFTAGTLERIVTYNRPLPPPPFPPELILVALIAGGIVGIGMFFARQEKVAFSLDVPDFPPVSRTKIGLDADTVLSVFAKVNENYRWEYTPLTVYEVKNGFKNIYYKGSPIFITDYNTEYLLNELVRRRTIKEFLDYYGLAGWEAKSGRTIRYLAMLRKLRDICVNNAIPFTSLGESEVCDSEINVVGQTMYLHFYEKDDSTELFGRVLATLSKGITLVLFKDDAEKADFSALLNSPSRAPLITKLEVENSSILLLTYPELEKMVQEFKGV